MRKLTQARYHISNISLKAVDIIKSFLAWAWFMFIIAFILAYVCGGGFWLGDAIGEIPWVVNLFGGVK